MKIKAMRNNSAIVYCYYITTEMTTFRRMHAHRAIIVITEYHHHNHHHHRQFIHQRICEYHIKYNKVFISFSFLFSSSPFYIFIDALIFFSVCKQLPVVIKPLQNFPYISLYCVRCIIHWLSPPVNKSITHAQPMQYICGCFKYSRPSTTK